MEKNHVFIDFDGMLFDTLPAQTAYFNHKYGVNTASSEYLSRNNDVHLVLQNHLAGITLNRDDVYDDFCKYFLESIEHHLDVLPMKDMPRVIKQVSLKYKLTILTARHTQSMPVIAHLRDKYIPYCVHDVHCVWGHQLADGATSISKRQFIESRSGTKILFFDDTPYEVEDTKDIIPSFLFDPTNAYAYLGLENRVQSWQEIGDMLL